ncbi:MAG: sigma-54 dependent transcriptional regulator [bacterium]|nr:sigma-54 dependent transcriptional regulator [bacterium]
MVRILVVDDQASQTDSLVILLRREGFRAEGVYSAEQAMAFLSQREVDLVITDLKMDPEDGIWLTEQIEANYPEVIVLIMTAYGTIETAVQAVRCGAFDYILKPVQLEQLQIVVERSLRWGQMRRRVKELEGRLAERDDRPRFLGSSLPILKVLEMVDRIAGADSSVLICGESGTGKELIAEMIHRLSPRRDQPLVIVNCGALPETLQESELFGHLRGAFTGATRDKKGLLAEADSGTLFLDEVGELSPPAQVKLLRFLENGECRRVGDTHVERLDVRVLAATNRDLSKAVTEGYFRADLYYRLNVIPLNAPPLRDIREDIPLIARTYLGQFAVRMKKSVPRISDECMDLLVQHSWPGNVRELRNLMERAVVVDRDSVITVADMPEQFQWDGAVMVDAAVKQKLSLKDLEKHYILSTLEECRGNRRKTGEVLGITKATLWRKLTAYQGETRDGVYAEEV